MGKKKKQNIPLRPEGDFYSSTRQENEYKINKIAGYVSLILEVGMLLMVLLNSLNIFILDTSKFLILAIVLLPFTISTFVITGILKVEKPWVKFWIIGCESTIVLMLFSVLSMHVVLALAIPIVTSFLYFNKKVCFVSIITSTVAILLGHVFSVYFSIVFDDPIIVGMYNSLVYGFVPRFIQFVLIALICYYATALGTEMMEEGYIHAKKTDRLLKEQRKTHYEIVKNLATIAENKSKETGDHIDRVFEYMYLLSIKAGYSEEDSYNIALASMLHDIGKLIVDESILSKPGKLTDEEFERMKEHVSYGKYLLSNTNNDVLNMAANIAEHHHERWDGKGYLSGLTDGQTDIYSAMMSVVDVFDALTSIRCYKEAWSKEEALEEIKKGSGTQFSPEVVDLFVKNFDEIGALCDKLHEKDKLEK